MQFQQVIPEGVHDIHLAVSIPIIHHYALNFSSTDAFILKYTDYTRVVIFAGHGTKIYGRQVIWKEPLLF